MSDKDIETQKNNKSNKEEVTMEKRSQEEVVFDALRDKVAEEAAYEELTNIHEAIAEMQKEAKVDFTKVITGMKQLPGKYTRGLKGEGVMNAIFKGTGQKFPARAVGLAKDRNIHRAAAAYGATGAGALAIGKGFAGRKKHASLEKEATPAWVTKMLGTLQKGYSGIPAKVKPALGTIKGGYGRIPAKVRTALGAGAVGAGGFGAGRISRRRYR